MPHDAARSNSGRHSTPTMSHFRELYTAADAASIDHDTLFNTSSSSPNPRESSACPPCSPAWNQRASAAASGRSYSLHSPVRPWSSVVKGPPTEEATECAGGPPASDRSLWPDALLVAAVRDDLPDPEALNVLAVRFGPPLWRRCLRLTGNCDKAGDLAQETWRRLLRTRGSLRPEKNFRAYLTTVATNIWRDGFRAARRAGAMAEHRLVALDAAGPASNGEAVPTVNVISADGCGGMITLAEVVPDAYEVETRARRLLIEDLHHALACLSPLHREVLLARFLHGESCALIGRRYARTEQAISGWVRDALCQARGHLGAMNLTARRE